MKKILSLCLLLTLAFSCREWEPVLTITYPEPGEREPVMMEVNTTIAALKQLYLDNGGKAVEILSRVVIGGQVISSDQSGNIYRDLYIQDETGAICVKVGKSSMYSDYKLGQWVYIDCSGLKIGSYNGMPQLGVEDESDSGYDTAYIDAQYLIDTHIFRGRVGRMPEARELTAAELSTALSEGGFKNNAWGSLVTLKGLTYGAKTDYDTDNYKRIFAILYPDDSSENRIFLSDKTYGVTTWAMSKAKLLENIAAGKFEGAKTSGGAPLEGDLLQALIDNATPVTMSQYFSLGTVPVQIRTSGYAKFADAEIDPEVIGDPDSKTADGKAVDVTGLLTLYNGAAQFTLIDLEGVQRTPETPANTANN
jgi:hypothetical protein